MNAPPTQSCWDPPDHVGLTFREVHVEPRASSFEPHLSAEMAIHYLSLARVALLPGTSTAHIVAIMAGVWLQKNRKSRTVGSVCTQQKWSCTPEPCQLGTYGARDRGSTPTICNLSKVIARQVATLVVDATSA